MKIKRIMFSFWDGGTGHFIRIMSLASEAYKMGIEVGFITSQKYLSWIENENRGYQTYIIPNRNPKAVPPNYSFPLYSHTFGHAQRLRGLRFDDVDWLLSTTEAEILALKNFRPNLVVNDYRDTIRTAAQYLNIPVVAITHSTGNVDGLALGWWVKVPDDLILPDCRESFNVVREKYHLYPIEDEREMFSGDINILPSIPEIDPLIKKSDNSFYVGLLSSWKPINKKFYALKNRSIPKIFSYVGEKTRPQYGYEKMLSEIVAQNQNIGFYIVGDTKRYCKNLNDNNRVKIRDFIPAERALRDSSILINHGGHGTLLIALSLGIPIICVGPYHSDCTTVFREIEKQGAGVMINFSKGSLERRGADDLGEGVEIMGYWNSEITTSMINDRINNLLTKSEYRLNAQRLGNSINSLGGSRQVLDICQKQYS